MKNKNGFIIEMMCRKKGKDLQKGGFYGNLPIKERCDLHSGGQSRRRVEIPEKA